MRHVPVLVAAMISLVALTGFFLFMIEEPLVQPAGAISKPASRSTRHVLIGDRIIVGDLDNNDPGRSLCLVRDKEDAEVLPEVVQMRDQDRMHALIRDRRAWLVGNRTAATLLARGRDLCRVRIEAGEQRGKEGWISPEFLLRSRPR